MITFNYALFLHKRNKTLQSPSILRFVMTVYITLYSIRIKCQKKKLAILLQSSPFFGLSLHDLLAHQHVVNRVGSKRFFVFQGDWLGYTLLAQAKRQRCRLIVLAVC